MHTRALVPEDLNGRAERRSFIRAATAIALGLRAIGHTDQVLKTTWRDDALAARITKAAQAPTDTTGWPADMAPIVWLPRLAPSGAGARLLGLSNQIDMAGVVSIKLPHIPTPDLPVVAFVQEGRPAPFVELDTGASVTLGPTKKILVATALTNELLIGSPTVAEPVIGAALEAATQLALDQELFSSNAPNDVSPGGILHGVVPIDSAGTPGVEGIADDLGKLSAAISAAGINSDDMAIVTTATLATKIRVLTSPKFNNIVMSSPALADGTVIGVSLRGLYTGYTGGVTVETSRQTTVHVDTAPTDISTPGSPPVVAFPVKSMPQTDSTALKVRCWCCWTNHPGAVQQINGAAW